MKLDMRSGHCYTDFKIRCNAELEQNKKYFQPKEWTIDKLLYNYDLLFHFKQQDNKLNDDLVGLLKDHIKGLYEDFLNLLEPEFLSTVMSCFDNQYVAASKALGIHRTTLKKKMTDHGMEKGTRDSI